MEGKNSWFRFIFLIGWFSLILFLVDFAKRTGKWWFHLIALSIVVSTVIGSITEIKEKKKKENKE